MIAFLKSILAFSILIFNTLLFTFGMYFFIILKIIIPNVKFKKKCTEYLVILSECWIKFNSAAFAFLHNTQFEVSGLEGVSNKKWYFLMCNHQSFTDIFVLQKILTGKIPPFKYFVKQSLIFMPLLGLAWWALDCIFMKRYSKKQVEANPALREVDRKTTHEKCLLFKDVPVTIVNFVEGTRFTEKKHEDQKSIYKYLLNPRSGGLAYMIAAMDGQVHDLLNITIAYPGGPYRFWDFLGGKIQKIVVRIQVVPIPDMILEGDYYHDADYRTAFKAWLNGLWKANDEWLALQLEK